MRGAAVLAAAGWLLAGCSTLSDMNPINWWHREQGGKIAEERPAAPGADEPYPKISTVPAKPEVPDKEALKKLTDSLIADRTNAQHAAQSAPLADPSSPTASPNLFGVGTAPPPGPATAPAATGAGASPPAPSGAANGAASGAANGAASGAPSGAASASMPAVTAPPSPPSSAPPSPAPRKAVQSTPLETPVTAPPPAEAAPQPPLPESPPARPVVAGSPPPAAPVTAAPMPLASTGPAATIVFVTSSSDLSAPAAEEVKAFAAKRGTATIGVTGYGDAISSDPDAQSAALNLGLARAQSIMEALKADGVPGASIRVSAEASGNGAALRLIP